MTHTTSDSTKCREQGGLAGAMHENFHGLQQLLFWSQNPEAVQLFTNNPLFTNLMGDAFVEVAVEKALKRCKTLEEMAESAFFRGMSRFQGCALKVMRRDRALLVPQFQLLECISETQENPSWDLGDDFSMPLEYLTEKYLAIEKGLTTLRKTKPAGRIEKDELVITAGTLAILHVELEGMKNQLDHLMALASSAPSDTFDTSGLFESSNERTNLQAIQREGAALREAIETLMGPGGPLVRYQNELAERNRILQGTEK